MNHCEMKGKPLKVLWKCWDQNVFRKIILVAAHGGRERPAMERLASWLVR